MASEAAVQRDVWIELARRSFAPVTLFRTNSGKAWMSNLGPAGVSHTRDGSLVIQAPRPVALGMAMINGDTVPGLTDLTGFTLVKVTPEMVGRVLPVFTGIETKASKNATRRKNQTAFIQRLVSIGAIAGFASSVAGANEIIDAWHRGEAPVPL